MTPAETVRQIYQDYAARDIAGALTHCADDICFQWIAEPSQSRYAGTCAGKDAFLARLMQLDSDFEYLSFEATAILADGDRVAAETRMRLRRRTTDEEIEVNAADFWLFRDGKPVEMREYYDTALIASVL